MEYNNKQSLHRVVEEYESAKATFLVRANEFIERKPIDFNAIQGEAKRECGVDINTLNEEKSYD